MESSKKHRKVLRAAFTKGANDLELMFSQHPDQAGDEDYRRIQVAFELLANKHGDMKIVDGVVYDALLAADVSEDELLLEIEQRDAYDKRFADLKLRVESLLLTRNTAACSEDRRSILSDARSEFDGVMDGIAHKRKFKLPAIEFKKFDGNIREWLPFWAQFKKAHEDIDIANEDKIEYLRQATVAGSRARQLVESFPAIGENYENILSALKSRFGRDDLQIEVYVRELLKLIINNCVSRDKMDLATLYDRIETQLRALDTLGITSEKCAAMLFPLIESCLPEDLLRTWQRVGRRTEAITKSNLGSNESLVHKESLEDHLKNLMCFLRNEVENEQRISLASEGFGLRCDSLASTKDNSGKLKKLKQRGCLPTAAGLINCGGVKCVFCDGAHESEACFKAQEFALERKRDILTGKGACFRCLKTGHISRRCRGRLKCIMCSGPHVVLMCPKLPAHKHDEPKSETVPAEQTLVNNTSGYVFLETLRVMINTECGSREIRALIDGGSQRSYILKSTAQQLGCKSKRRENIIHCLFGGTQQERRHDCFDVRLSHGDYSCTLELLDQAMICQNIPPVFYGPWMEELKHLNIHLDDAYGEGPIELLIGADVAGKLYTGRRHILTCGLVAVETLLGWTISGRIPVSAPTTSTTLTVFSLLVNEACVAELWKLDVLGITEPSEKKSREEMAEAAQQLFLQTVTKNEERRYEVRLPWLEGHPPLPDNYNSARKRLDATVRKLRKEELFEKYDFILKEWLNEEIIEIVPAMTNDSNVHYLPHRPVVKDNSLTTKIRPVFDASAREKDKPSLNHCLEKGPNLVELIPSVLLRFRIQRIGVVSDIRKAFLQISIHEADRDFLRFLWLDEEGNEQVYRHRRVVFGLSSSPFLLGTTIDHHLSEQLKQCELNSTYSCESILKLRSSFYVDNCVTSVPDEDALDQFIREASMVMAEAHFDLRGWEFTRPTGTHSNALSVLGLTWHPTKDTLAISESCVKDDSPLLDSVVTKRLILSVTQRIFDPIGVTCPATLKPKLLLQRLWGQRLSWDAPVDDDTEQEFHKWIKELRHLLAVELPRWILAGPGEAEHLSLHMFCDASKDAYAAVIFLRIEKNGTVVVRLLTAKARVAPLKKMTIPRLELLAATIGARLCRSVRTDLGNNIECFYWSDSSTAISWIRRQEDWAPFVGNRVAEIRSLTKVEDWRHVPGVYNPADLPSRGCSPKHLLESRWWEGPRWLYGPQTTWASEDLEYDEEEINGEKRKRMVVTLLNCSSDEWHLTHFSKYTMTIRMIAWVFRFTYNSSSPQQRRRGSLTVDEINDAELFVFKVIQQETFRDETDNRLSALNPFCSDSGVIRLKSRVSNRQDSESFRFPIVLPAKHPVIRSLIFEAHTANCHVGTQGLLSMLREKYWIMGGRRAIRAVISKCVTCKRHDAKPYAADTPSLPFNRVRDAVPFEVIGIDFAGPLYLRTREKAWVCLFTCAVYRAVHLELTTSLSTPSFLQALRRFVARRGRPRTIYSDRGTNFVGTENAFAKLDWPKIMEEISVQRISWRFNPPTAAWWGGFWERLVGVLKGLLRKVLGRASLNYEDLLTLLCDCEATMNARPLTYESGDSEELMALTPAMFLRDQPEIGIPDCDAVDQASLCRRMRYKQTLRETLRRRFRNEYLGQLKSLNCRKRSKQLVLGEIVLIGNDNDKRIDWPLGRVTELLPGPDGQVCLVRVDTARGQLLRPIQRLYPLECISSLPIQDERLQGKDNPEDASAGVAGVSDVLSDIKSRAIDSEDVSAGVAGVSDVLSDIKSREIDSKDVSTGVAGVSDVLSDIKSRAIVSKEKLTRSGRVSRLPIKFR